MHADESIQVIFFKLALDRSYSIWEYFTLCIVVYYHKTYLTGPAQVLQVSSDRRSLNLSASLVVSCYALVFLWEDLKKEEKALLNSSSEDDKECAIATYKSSLDVWVQILPPHKRVQYLVRTGLAITFGNRTISGHNLLVSRQNLVCTVAMYGHREEPCSSSSSSGPPPKKRTVSRKTVEKWVVENDRELNTTVWLKFEGDRNHVFSQVCCLFAV